MQHATRNTHRTVIRPTLRGLGAAIALSLCLAAPSWAGKANDILVYASDSEVENISPYHNNLREGVVLSHLAWDTLIYRDPRTGDYKPQLATQWEWESPTALRLQLREGVTFHNGDPFSADDVVYTFNVVTGPEAKIITRQNTGWIERVEKISDTEVRIVLKEPFPAALEYLAGPTPIYPAKYVENVGLEGFSKAPIGTGPYRITTVTPGQGVSMERFDDYFKASAKGQPAIGKLVFKVIRDPEARSAQLMTGEVDWIWRVPADQAEAMATMPQLQVISDETMRVGFLTLNNQGESPNSAPLKDVRVRQAINHAINREAIAASLVRGGSQVVHAPCFRTQFGCETAGVTQYAYDPAKAKALLAEAGYPEGFDTDLWAYREREYAEAMIGDLRKVGIRARLHFVQYPAMRAEAASGRAAMTFQAWGSFSVADASAFVGNYFTGGADDTAKDAQVIEWVQAGNTASDPEERKKNYAAALNRISAEAMWAPLFSYSVNYAFSPELQFEAFPDELPRFFLSRWK